MLTKPKSNSVITHEVMGDGTSARISFNVKDAGTVTLDVGNVSSDIYNRAALHGLIQRVSDAAAISRDPATGKPATPADKLAAMKAIVDHYNSGTSEWSRRREGGGGETGGLLYLALARAYPGKHPDELREFVKARSSAERNALLISEKLKPHVDAIRAARAPTTVDAEELLSSL